jgi:hypothetical protein
MITFEAFPKLPRLFKEITVTEKIDGTNAQIIITEDGEIGAASRQRLITPEEDNYGFARWVQDHKNDLMLLGPGRHFGEWWGSGIQRNYGIREKRFSLFNSGRWCKKRPACCEVVPVLYEGIWDDEQIRVAWQVLTEEGSKAAPGFMKPEGIVIYHHAANQYFKAPFDK